MTALHRRTVALAALALALAACAATGDDLAGLPTSPAPVQPSSASPSLTPSAAPSPSPTASFTPTLPQPPSWTVGASPLPTRADGFGVVLDTPPQLVDRRLPTIDLLPPPTDGAFHSEILGIDELIRDRMGETWSPDCPVTLTELRYVTVTFWGFDSLPHTGELVVNAEAAADVVTVFDRLYDERFPIEEMRLVTTADVRTQPTGDGNNTSAYYCRPAVGQTTGWSAHAYGLAIDVNPFHNPYERGDLVLPELAGAYLDRGNERPGMILAGDEAVRAFRDIGWSWGGDFASLKDYMHFSQTGT